MAFGILNFIDADGSNWSQYPMSQAPLHYVLYRVAYLFPGSPKRNRRLFPGEFARPMRQELHVDISQLMLASSPGNLFDDHPAGLAVYPPHPVEQEHQIAQYRDELEAPLTQMIVARRRLPAF